jgi:hypothetical protein
VCLIRFSFYFLVFGIFEFLLDLSHVVLKIKRSLVDLMLQASICCGFQISHVDSLCFTPC